MFLRSLRSLRPFTLTAAALALTTPLLAWTAAPATAGDAGPVISEITTANESGGLTPYIPLYTTVRLTFTDATASGPEAYRIDVTGPDFAEQYSHVVWPDYAEPGGFTASVDAYGLPVDEPLQFTVSELDGDEVVAASAPQEFTFTFVDHPSYLSTSSTKVEGRWTYKAGSTGRLSLTGAWEEGTRVNTQVWVSKGKKFTSADWDRNVYGTAALVKGKLRDELVSSFRIPKRLKGHYVWVSVLGWKPGEGGWRFTVTREYVR